jgi:cytochrome c553
MLAGIFLSGSAAQTPDAIDSEPQYAPQGAATCLTCHTNPAVTPVLDSIHALQSNPGTPFAQHQCESCHGESHTLSVDAIPRSRLQGRAVPGQ